MDGGQKAEIGDRQGARPINRNGRHNWNTNARDGRSFAEVAAGKAEGEAGARDNKVNPNSVIHLKTDTILKDWYKRSVLVGEAHSLDHIATYHLYMKSGVTIKYLGGLFLVLEFGKSVDAKEYLKDKERWREWFKWLKVGERDGLRYGRLAWLKIIRLPLRLWDEENFSRIVGWHYYRKETMDNEELMVEAGGETFKIGVVEYTDDWSPFKPCSFDKTVESDDEEEEQETDEENVGDESDGVSDTCMGDRQENEEELEDGEFNPEEHAEGKDGNNGNHVVIMEEDHVYGDKDNGGMKSNEEREAGNVTEVVYGKCNESKENDTGDCNQNVGQATMDQAPTRLPPLGCFSPFPSQIGPHSFGPIDNQVHPGVQFMGCNDKRRRIGFTYPSRSNFTETGGISFSIPHPNLCQVETNHVPCSNNHENEESSANSTEEELRATMDIGKRVGFQFSDGDQAARQYREAVIGCAGEKSCD
ncbi:hypothetical protein L1887_35598 [Cichorium endivia]|nr:hypothetical protein L1887_35598 [Cichorium endivia]